MCDTCGCNLTQGNTHLVENHGKHAQTADGKAAITVLQNLLSENDHQAHHNREHFARHGVLAINLMSSPGAGKTRLLASTIQALQPELRIGVIEGDLETENDAQKIRELGVPAVQIVTGTACHLDAHLVHQALHELDLSQIDLLFIENVGNLVCPASFDLGQHYNVTLLSVTEGEDKPAKYPPIFRIADVVLLTKIDLLPLLEEFDVNKLTHYLQNLSIEAPLLQISAKTQTGLPAWLNWLKKVKIAQLPAKAS